MTTFLRLFAPRQFEISMLRLSKPAMLMLCSVAILSLCRSVSFSLECPNQPIQVTRDWEVEVNAAVAKIGPVSGGELKNKTKNVTQDLLGKLPDAGKVYLQQMMFSAYCTGLRDDRTISEAEKVARLRDYISEVQRVTNPPSPKPIVKPAVPVPSSQPIDATVKRFGITLGWQLARYEFFYNSPIPEAAAAAPGAEREIRTMLEQDHYPNPVAGVDAQQLMSDVLLYYGSTNAEKHAMILLGMAALRASLVGASQNQSNNQQMAELAHGMVSEIDSAVLPNKERIFQALLRQKPTNVPGVIDLVNNTH